MRKNTILFASIALLLGCSASNELRVSWKTGEYEPKTYKNIGVVAILPKTSTRVEIETAVADAFAVRGIPCRTTWSIWAFANNPELLKEAGFEGENMKKIIIQKVTEQKIDALLVISLFDSKKETRYVPGRSASIGVGFSPGMYPAYGYPYYGYIGYSFTTMSEPGYYEDASTYFTETNLYDIASEKLIWTGQISTEMQSPLEEEVYKFARVLVGGMLKDKVLTK
jgi:hypothetical protein